jgi:hypothetical protein
VHKHVVDPALNLSSGALMVQMDAKTITNRSDQVMLAYRGEH